MDCNYCSKLKSGWGIVLLLVCCSWSVLATDNDEAGKFFQQGLTAARQKKYRVAAEFFLDAKKYADNASMKGKALKEARRCFQQAKLYGQEFKCIETLLNSYPNQVNYGDMIDREYSIADSYYHGHRDPAFWSLRWIPWLTEADKTMIFYQKVLKRAPFAKQAPLAQLRVARLYIDNGKPDKALKILRKIIAEQQNREVIQYAYLELANALLQLSQKGDGDGRYNRETVQVLKDFLKKYPKSSERAWAEQALLKSKDIAAQRLYELAKFYYHIHRTDPAKRYLSEVLTEYPDSVAVDRSEEMLTNIDRDFIPTGFRPELKSRIMTYKAYPIPDEDSPIMITPQESNNKWLLPIRDLGIGPKNIKISKLNAAKEK